MKIIVAVLSVSIGIVQILAHSQWAWTAFFFLVFAGVLAKDYFIPIRNSIKVTNKRLLLLYTALLISGVTVQEGLVWLFLGGVVIQAVPTITARLLQSSRPALAKDIFSFATYGGGNRGIMALDLIAPSLLPSFLMADLGNAISLFSIYPLLAMKGVRSGSFFQRAILPILPVAAMVATGVILGQMGKQVGPIPGLADFKTVIHALIAVLIPLQLGIEMAPLNIKGIMDVVGRMLRVRLAIFTPLAVLALANGWREILLPLMVFAILPTSSVAPSLVDQEIAKDVTTDAVVTASMFIILLGAIVFSTKVYLCLI